MWRGVLISRSTSSVSSPKEPRASRRAPAIARGQLVGGVHLPHPLAAAARARFEQHRVADLLDGEGERGVVEAGAVRPGHHRHPGLGHGLLGADLVAHRLDGRGRWADERDPGVGAGGGERGVLAQETVAGMDGLSAGGAGRVDHRRDAQVALGRRGRPDPDGHVGQRNVRGMRVGIGVHGDRPDPEPPQRAQHPHGDLAPVGHQHRVKHAGTRSGGGATALSHARCVRTALSRHGGRGKGHGDHIRKTPKPGGSSGALAAADRASPSTVRVSRGSITPSSHRRAVE